MAIIYKATNLKTNKSYIGYTNGTLERRIQRHFYNSNILNYAFYRAIRKYGRDSFEWSVVYENSNAKFCLEQMEPYYIIKFDTFGKNGYNMTSGGEKGPSLSGKLNPMFGKTHSKETKAKLKISGGKSKGKTYEERYGKEKAKILRKTRAKDRRNWLIKHPPTGKNNSNYNPTIYNFINKDQEFIGTMLELREHFPYLTKVNTSYIMNGYTMKGWKLKS